MQPKRLKLNKMSGRKGNKSAIAQQQRQQADGLRFVLFSSAAIYAPPRPLPFICHLPILLNNNQTDRPGPGQRHENVSKNAKMDGPSRVGKFIVHHPPPAQPPPSIPLFIVGTIFGPSIFFHLRIRPCLPSSHSFPASPPLCNILHIQFGHQQSRADEQHSFPSFTFIFISFFFHFLCFFNHNFAGNSNLAFISHEFPSASIQEPQKAFPSIHHRSIPATSDGIPFPFRDVRFLFLRRFSIHVVSCSSFLLTLLCLPSPPPFPPFNHKLAFFFFAPQLMGQ